MNQRGFPVRATLLDECDEAVYEGEAVYRPARPHPLNGEPVPQLGIPDDAMLARPQGDKGYRLRIREQVVQATAIYLDRVATCWWFLLEHGLSGPPF
jgi:hypothetical protein